MPTYTGDSGNNVIFGSGEGDRISGLEGDDTLFGGQGDDEIYGGAGNDMVSGEEGGDLLVGGPGNDRLVVDNASDVAVELAGEGTDTLITAVNYVLPTGVSVEILQMFQYAFSINLTGNELASTIYGNEGDNIIIGGPTGTMPDRMVGEGGSDTYFVNNVGDVIEDDVTSGENRVYANVSFALQPRTWMGYMAAADRSALTPIDLTGSQWGQQIHGNAGDNRLSGMGGSDTLYGYEGNDTLDGGDGIDILFGGDGIDTLTGGETVDGGDSYDYWIADYSAGYQSLTVAFGQSIVIDNGTSAINVEHVTISTGSGDDRFNVANGAYAGTVNAGTGTDTLVYRSPGDGAATQYGVSAFGRPMAVWIGHPSNVWFENLEHVEIYGSDLDESFEVGGGPFAIGSLILDGGGGFDQLAVDFDVATSINFVVNSDGTITSNQGQFISFERFSIHSGDGSDIIRGGASWDNLWGGGGNDTLSGGAGQDTLFGEAGVDSLTGGAGRDTFIGTALELNGDTITDFEGGDRIVFIDYEPFGFSFSLSGNTLTYTGGSLTLLGLTGQLILGETSSGLVQLTLQQPQVTGTQNVDTLSGSNLADTIVGLAGDDGISGRGGNDEIDGGPGLDIIHGDAGDDRILGDSGSDVLYGDGGSDEIRGGDGDDQIRGDGVPVGESGADLIFGGSGEDDIEGGAGNDTLFGDGDNDWIRGGLGQDYIDGGDGDDYLSGDGVEGSDIHRDTILGGAGNDRISVGYGDTIFGGDGIDTIWLDLGDNALGGITADLRDLANNGVVTIAGAQIREVEYVEYIELTAFDDNVVAGPVVGSNGITIIGREGNDQLTGSAGSDTISGDEGNDILAGGLGTDILSGGSGTDVYRDTAAGLNGDRLYLQADDRIIISDANLAGFSFTLTGESLAYTGGSLTLVSDVAGPLYVRAAVGGGVELSFAPPADVRNDFNGDGRSDILWRNIDGQLSNWLGQANGGFVQNNANAAAVVPTSWSIAGTGDFNGDGRDDILWRNVDGQLSNWLATASGGFVQNNANAAAVVPTAWSVAGTGDFNGDGRDDILWRNTNGTVSDWLGQSNGGFIANDVNAARFVPTSWSVVGTGDFNGDGRDDILWRNSNGQLSDWLGQANGGFVLNDAVALTQVDTAWSVAGTGDFNGDGRDDILWRNTNGTISTWSGQANGGFVNNGAISGVFVPLAWSVVAVGDYNGDGRDDILWRNADGTVTDWLANPNGSFTPNDAAAAQSVPTAWHVQPEAPFI